MCATRMHADEVVTDAALVRASWLPGPRLGAQPCRVRAGVLLEHEPRDGPADLACAGASPDRQQRMNDSAFRPLCRGLSIAPTLPKPRPAAPSPVDNSACGS